jgi:hypothetical protein
LLDHGAHPFLPPVAEDVGAGSPKSVTNFFCATVGIERRYAKKLSAESRLRRCLCAGCIIPGPTVRRCPDRIEVAVSGAQEFRSRRLQDIIMIAIFVIGLSEAFI